MKRLKERLKTWWHDAFYWGAGDMRTDFAVRCKDIVGHIDENQVPAGRLGIFRFYLHLSLCAACMNYFRFSQLLKKSLRISAKSEASTPEVQNLNQQLTKKYAR